MSYDTWKTTDPADQWLGSSPQSGDRLTDDDEIAAAMFNVTVDEYLSNKSLDRYLRRAGEDEDDQGDDQLPF